MRNRLSDFLVYRWRYILGYSFIAIVIGAMLVVAAFYIPHELRQGEIDSALTSSTLGTTAMSPQTVIDLPYHLLQKIGFILFGVSTFTIKLPSIILGAFTALGVFLLIRTWFSARVAILATLLGIVTSQFLFLSQDGTPLIMYTFLSVWLLFVATFVTRRKHFGLFWKVLTILAMAASMYTPMGIYLVLVMLTTAIFHPHIRFLIRKFNKYKLSVALVLGAGALVPLGYAIYLDHSVAGALLGVPQGVFDILANLKEVAKNAFGFMLPSDNYLVQPLYPLGLAILMAVGLVRILTHRYTARSYITLAWGITTFAFVLLNPTKITHFYPVAVILISYGIIYMIRSWYQIFPRNPYARVAGMIPLVVLVLAIVTSGITHYINTYHNNPEVMRYYSQDLRLFKRALSDNAANKDTTHVVVSRGELPFYQLVAKYDKRFSVSDAPVDKTPIQIATRGAIKPKQAPARIIVSARASEADRFYIYK